MSREMVGDVKRLLYQDPSVMREVGSGASGHPRLPIIAVKSLRVMQ
jgi:hypothetical protein